jgi:hypothetical protein
MSTIAEAFYAIAKRVESTSAAVNEDMDDAALDTIPMLWAMGLDIPMDDLHEQAHAFGDQAEEHGGDLGAHVTSAAVLFFLMGVKWAKS